MDVSNMIKREFSLISEKIFIRVFLNLMAFIYSCFEFMKKIPNLYFQLSFYLDKKRLIVTWDMNYTINPSGLYTHKSLPLDIWKLSSWQLLDALEYN